MSKTFLPRKTIDGIVHRLNPFRGPERSGPRIVSAPSPRRRPRIPIRGMIGIVVSQGTTKSYPTVFLIYKTAPPSRGAVFSCADNKSATNGRGFTVATTDRSRQRARPYATGSGGQGVRGSGGGVPGAGRPGPGISSHVKPRPLVALFGDWSRSWITKRPLVFRDWSRSSITKRPTVLRGSGGGRGFTPGTPRHSMVRLQTSTAAHPVPGEHFAARCLPETRSSQILRPS